MVQEIKKKYCVYIYLIIFVKILVCGLNVLLLLSPLYIEIFYHQVGQCFLQLFVDLGIFIGTIGFFLVLFLIYARTFPVIAQAELKTIVKTKSSKYNKNKDGR